MPSPIETTHPDSVRQAQEALKVTEYMFSMLTGVGIDEATGQITIAGNSRLRGEFPLTGLPDEVLTSGDFHTAVLDEGQRINVAFMLGWMLAKQSSQETPIPRGDFDG